jgi:hypothetical protein
MNMSVPIVVDGQWVSEQFATLAEVISDYDPSFQLRWIPPEDRKTNNERAKPMVIWDLSKNLPIRYLSERDNPVDVLASLFESDNKHGDVLDRMDKREAALQLLEMRRQMDEHEEMKDQAAFLMRTKKNYIKFNGKKLDDQLREIPGSRKKVIP